MLTGKRRAGEARVQTIPTKRRNETNPLTSPVLFSGFSPVHHPSADRIPHFFMKRRVEAMELPPGR